MPTTTTSGNTTTGVDAGLGTDIGSILAIINGLSGNSGWNKIAQTADPWGPNRAQYATELNSFMADPSSVLKDPAFTAAETVGAENISRQAGAAGMASSGNRLADLFTYGQTAGLNFEQQKFQQLQELAGVTAGSPGTAAGLELQGLQNQGTNLATGISGLAGMLPGILQLLTGGSGPMSGLPALIKQIIGGGGGSGGTPTFGPDNTGGMVDNTSTGLDTGGTFNDPAWQDWLASIGGGGGTDWTSGFDLTGG